MKNIILIETVDELFELIDNGTLDPAKSPIKIELQLPGNILIDDDRFQVGSRVNLRRFLDYVFEKLGIPMSWKFRYDDEPGH